MCQTLKNSRQTLTNMNILLAVTQVSADSGDIDRPFHFSFLSFFFFFCTNMDHKAEFYGQFR